MSGTSAAISDLRSMWATLQDLDRALRIRAIHKSGTSFSELAKALKRSPSLLRHLVDSLQAPLEDQLLARKGKLTTNELVRRAKAAKTRKKAKEAEALALKGTRESIRGCKAICEWLIREGRQGPYGEQIILEAQRFLAAGEQTGELPPGVMPAGMPVTKLIQRSRPRELKNDEVNQISWFGFWLARWAFYLMPDSSVRYRAIELAYENQPR